MHSSWLKFVKWQLHVQVHVYHFVLWYCISYVPGIFQDKMLWPNTAGSVSWQYEWRCDQMSSESLLAYLGLTSLLQFTTLQYNFKVIIWFGWYKNGSLCSYTKKIWLHFGLTNWNTLVILACSRLQDSGEKSFGKKKCEKRAGAPGTGYR